MGSASFPSLGKGYQANSWKSTLGLGILCILDEGLPGGLVSLLAPLVPLSEGFLTRVCAIGPFGGLVKSRVGPLLMIFQHCIIL